MTKNSLPNLMIVFIPEWWGGLVTFLIEFIIFGCLSFACSRKSLERLFASEHSWKAGYSPVLHSTESDLWPCHPPPLRAGTAPSCWIRHNSALTVAEIFGLWDDVGKLVTGPEYTSTILKMLSTDWECFVSDWVWVWFFFSFPPHQPHL